MAEAGIILSIGSKFGPGGLASLQAGIQMLGQLGRVVAENIKEFDQFSQVYKNVKIDISQANRESKGLIDTLEMMKGANRLTQAGVKATANEFATLNKMAIMAAKTTGDDVMTAFNGFINALSGGGTEYVRKFGMRIKETGTASEKMAEFMRVSQERLAGFSIEIDTASEGLGVLKNDLGTMAGLLYETATNANSTGSAFSLLHDVLGGVNDELDIMAQSGAPGWLDQVRTQVFEVSIAFADFTIDIYNFLAKVPVLGAAMKSVYGDTIKGLQTMKGGMQAVNQVTQQKTIDALTSYRDKLLAGDTGGGGGGARAGRRGGGRGGGGGGAGLSMEFSEEEAQFFADFGMDMADVFRVAFYKNALNATPADLELMGGGVSDDALAWAAGGGDMQDGEAKPFWNAELTDAELESWQQRWELMQQHRDYMAEHHQRLLWSEQDYIAQSSAMWKASIENRFQMMSGFFGNLSLLMQTESKTAFKVGKAAAISKSVIDTAQGAIAAYQAMAGIPYVGPFLGIAAAAAVSAYGAAMTKKISETKYGAGSGGSFVGTTGGGVSGVSAGGGYFGAGYGMGGGSTQTQIIQLNIDGEQVHEVIVNQNDKADQQGRRSFINK